MKTGMFDLAPVDGLKEEQLKEMANLFAEKCQKAAQQTIRDAAVCGNALNAMKERCKHGDWVPWLATNFDYSRQTAAAYMMLASNVKRFTFEPTSIREALRLISEQPAEAAESPIAPRAERIPNRVAVSKPFPEPVSCADELTDDPTPITEELTNRTSTPANRKASEAKRAVPMQITPEIAEEVAAEIEEKTLSDWSVAELLTFLKVSANDPKKRAKELRKAADELDPPKKFVPPDVDEVAEYCAGRNNRVDPETFVAHYAANGWKMSNGNKLNDWKAAIITWEKRDESTSKQTGNGRGRQAITDGNW